VKIIKITAQKPGFNFIPRKKQYDDR